VQKKTAPKGGFQNLTEMNTGQRPVFTGRYLYVKQQYFFKISLFMLRTVTQRHGNDKSCQGAESHFLT
jgi:hypothetical protein